jgi:DnaK suppressor protein
MTEEERQALKNKIVSEIEGLKASIASLEETSRPVKPDVSIGRLTRMEAINARGINEANLNASNTKLVKLERALSRVDDPEFGICAVCGEPIPVGRIMLMPEVTRCVRCAE